MEGSKSSIISKLQKDILQWQGFAASGAAQDKGIGLGRIEAAFPNNVFPTGTIHEFLNFEPEQAAASGGFIAGILSCLMKEGGICVWVSTAPTLFPPALKIFNIEPDRIIFVDLQKEKDVLWVTEEALKCEGVSAVIAELRELSFMQSRRLQLAVEQSKVTGFMLRSDPKKISTTACVARWKISSLHSELSNGIPGVGFPRWNIELLKVKNGNPGVFRLEWAGHKFHEIVEISMEQQRKAG